MIGIHLVKLPARRMGPFDRAHGPEYVERASRTRSGEQNGGKGNLGHLVPLPAGRRGPCLSRFGGKGHAPVKNILNMFPRCEPTDKSSTCDVGTLDPLDTVTKKISNPRPLWGDGKV